MYNLYIQTILKKDKQVKMKNQIKNILTILLNF